MKTDFALKLESTIQDIAKQEQGVIDLISKINLVQQGYDGIIDKQGNTQMYQLSFVGISQDDLKNNYSSVGDKINDFYGYAKGDWSIIKEGVWDDTKKTFTPNKPDSLNGDATNRFYTIIYQKLADRNDRNTFIDSVITDVVVKTSEKQDSSKVKSRFETYVNSLKSDYNVEHDSEIKTNSEIKKKEEYKTLTKQNYYNNKSQNGLSTFVTNNTDGAKYSNTLKSIYSTVNTNTDKTTYNGKIKLS
jgi:hypothetical protein